MNLCCLLCVFSGGDHIETRAVRSYLNNLEASLKGGKPDSRSCERPYSSMSWRSQDLANIENKSRLQSGKSSSYGQLSRPGSHVSKSGSNVYRSASLNISRPVSGQFDTTLSQKSGMISCLAPSERLMLETNKPRLLHRESMNRKLNQREQKVSSYSPQYSPREMQSRDHGAEEPIRIDTGDSIDAVTNGAGVLLDSYGNETDRTAVKFQPSPRAGRHAEELACLDSPPERLFKRYSNSHNSFGMNGESSIRSGEVTLRTESNMIVKREHSFRHKRTAGSARSLGSSLHTRGSGMSLTSHKSSCGPHSNHSGNARTTTVGPNSSVKSLMGYTGPKDITKNIHHKSAWYHVPGRYTTGERKYPPKRSQQRHEAKQLSKTIAPLTPSPHKMFMKSEYRKNNPNMIYKGYPGKDGHTCAKGQTYTPYPRDKKQYIMCDSCQHEAESLIAVREQEYLGMLEGESDEGVGLAPTVSGLMATDRPRQTGYVLEDQILPDDYVHPTTVTFKDTVVIN